ncbi:hypothetical protein BJ875DRAFT_497851 [Amylocarpus encephaloides]|uniref:Uncharacterized protein n=1 Tax=Amylocarpus encephaloides TaxID=45428 RepID=A0A9P8C315_9HELO|nr:hypothetical protein BJ875DRAFT_497851 [Amylocarpus encephaloides]
MARTTPNTSMLGFIAILLSTASITTAIPAPVPSMSHLNGGTLACGDRVNNDANNQFFATIANMQTATESFCGGLSKSGTTFSPTAGIPNYTEAFGVLPDIHLKVSYLGGGNKNCPTIDWSSSANLALCKRSFQAPINNCDTVNSAGKPNWKQGGSYQRDCIVYTISRS